MSRQRPVSLNECTTIRDEPNERVDPRQQTNSARRRRSLHTRALRWVRDTCAGSHRAHRVLLVALTMKDRDPELARGAIEHTFKQLRDQVRAGSLLTADSALPRTSRLAARGGAAAIDGRGTNWLNNTNGRAATTSCEISPAAARDADG